MRVVNIEQERESESLWITEFRFKMIETEQARERVRERGKATKMQKISLEIHGFARRERAKEKERNVLEKWSILRAKWFKSSRLGVFALKLSCAVVVRSSVGCVDSEDDSFVHSNCVHLPTKRSGKAILII